MKPYLIIIHPHFTLPGGAGKVVLELGSRLTSQWQVVVIAQQINTTWSNMYTNIIFENIQGPVTSKLSFWLLLPYWYWRTAKIIQQYQAKGKVQIFCNVFPAHWLGLIYKYFHPTIPCVWYCHEPSAFIYVAAWRKAIPSFFKRMLAEILQPIFAIFDRWCVRHVDGIFTNSLYSQQRIKQVYQRNSVVVYPGVDCPKQIMPWSERNNTIIAVGRLTKFKRFDILIQAFMHLQHTEYRLDIIGDGEEREHLMQLIRNSNYTDRIRILSGITDDSVLQKKYNQAKLFVSCAQHEPFGITLIEAMTHGVPIISDNSGGPQEIVQNGVTGQLIDCTAEQLRATIDQMLDDSEVCQQYSIQAARVCCEKYTWNKAVKCIQNQLS